MRSGKETVVMCINCGYSIRFSSMRKGGHRLGRRKEIKCPKCKMKMVR